jgi:ATP-dependent Clp protease ATP-binding subunit ClpA
VRPSHRYIPARQLPDRSVSLLDTARARRREPARHAGRVADGNFSYRFD